MSILIGQTLGNVNHS